MRKRIVLSQVAGLILAISVGCGGRLADDPSAEADGAIDSGAAAPSMCSVDSDCNGQCAKTDVCCCESASGTCFSPQSGECGGGEAEPPEGTSGGEPPI
jgi:hypothetical protein